jgi:hypothetical protein
MPRHLDRIIYLVGSDNLNLNGLKNKRHAPTRRSLIRQAFDKDGEVTLDADWQIGHKRQMEFYQWLIRKKGFQVSNIGYFVY